MVIVVAWVAFTCSSDGFKVTSNALKKVTSHVSLTLNPGDQPCKKNLGWGYWWGHSDAQVSMTIEDKTYDTMAWATMERRVCISL